MSLATNSWAKNSWLVSLPFPAPHPISTGARKEMGLGSRSCLGVGAALPRVQPALTKVTVKELSSSARWQLPSVREEIRDELFHGNPTGVLSWQPLSGGLPVGLQES